MLNIHFKSLLIIVGLLSLIGCTAIPTHIKLSSDLNLETKTYAFTQQPIWQVNSQDLRIARHLIEIVDGDNVASLINEEQSLRLLIEDNLMQAWTSNGLAINKNSEYQVDIKLIKALTTVTEDLVSYKVQSKLQIKIQLAHDGKKFVKIFRSNNDWDAAFTPSIARITTKLNVQLSQLLNQVIQDQELNDKLQLF